MYGMVWYVWYVWYGMVWYGMYGMYGMYMYGMYVLYELMYEHMYACECTCSGLQMLILAQTDQPRCGISDIRQLCMYTFH